MGEDPRSRGASDAHLLEQIRRDDPRAFDRFVEAYGDRLYLFGVRMCGDTEDARDMVQDTLLQAFRSLKGLREPKALRSWLYRVASNACLMRRRKGKYEPQRELSLDELMPRGDGARGIEIPDARSLPDDALARSRLRRAVHEAIAELAPHYRAVLVLRDMEQLSTREVSEALDLPEPTVKMRLHRARLSVRQTLERAAGTAHSRGGAP